MKKLTLLTPRRKPIAYLRGKPLGDRSMLLKSIAPKLPLQLQRVAHSGNYYKTAGWGALVRRQVEG